MMKTSSTSRKVATKGTSISAEEVRGYFLEISQSTRKTKALLRKVGIVSSGNTKKNESVHYRSYCIMRTSLPQFVLGYHGCDFSLVQQLLKADTELKFSENSYDWLGHGIYFWENAPYRAFEWAEEAAKNPRKVNGNISTPAVIGAVIDLGNCFDLSDTKHIDVVREAYNGVVALCKKSGEELPKNTAYCRDLDCKVINMAVELNERLGYLPFDSVRSPFFEGDKLYSGAYFQDKTHIQICIRKSECIKGYFLPKDFLKKLTG